LAARSILCPNPQRSTIRTADVLAIAHPDGVATLEVVARQLDATAPNAASVVQKKWAAWKCDAAVCTESTADRKYLSLTPILNAAGWYQKTPAAPQKLSAARYVVALDQTPPVLLPDLTLW
jgi:hypothetical protein